MMHGTGFTADENVTLRLGDDDVGSARSDGAGIFDTSFLIPRTYAGRGSVQLTVTAEGENSGRLGSAVFLLTSQ